MVNKDWGDLATWAGASVSVVSIFFVKWQVNKQVEEQKEQAFREARPYFVIKYNDNIFKFNDPEEPVPDFPSDLNYESFYDYEDYRDYSIKTGINDIQYIYIENISKKRMMLTQIVVYYKNKNKVFKIGKIDDDENYKLYLGEKGCLNTIDHVEVCFITELREVIKLYFESNDSSLKYCHPNKGEAR